MGIEGFGGGDEVDGVGLVELGGGMESVLWWRWGGGGGRGTEMSWAASMVAGYPRLPWL